MPHAPSRHSPPKLRPSPFHLSPPGQSKHKQKRLWKRSGVGGTRTEAVAKAPTSTEDVAGRGMGLASGRNRLERYIVSERTAEEEHSQEVSHYQNQQAQSSPPNYTERRRLKSISPPGKKSTFHAVPGHHSPFSPSNTTHHHSSRLQASPHLVGSSKQPQRFHKSPNRRKSPLLVSHSTRSTKRKSPHGALPSLKNTMKTPSVSMAKHSHVALDDTTDHKWNPLTGTTIPKLQSNTKSMRNRHRHARDVSPTHRQQSFESANRSVGIAESVACFEDPLSSIAADSPRASLMTEDNYSLHSNLSSVGYNDISPPRQGVRTSVPLHSPRIPRHYNYTVSYKNGHQQYQSHPRRISPTQRKKPRSKFDFYQELISPTQYHDENLEPYSSRKHYCGAHGATFPIPNPLCSHEIILSVTQFLVNMEIWCNDLLFNKHLFSCMQISYDWYYSISTHLMDLRRHQMKRISEKLGIEFAYIPGGIYMIGSPHPESPDYCTIPSQFVKVEGFYISKNVLRHSHWELLKDFLEKEEVEKISYASRKAAQSHRWKQRNDLSKSRNSFQKAWHRLPQNDACDGSIMSSNLVDEDPSNKGYISDFPGTAHSSEYLQTSLLLFPSDVDCTLSTSNTIQVSGTSCIHVSQDTHSSASDPLLKLPFRLCAQIANSIGATLPSYDQWEVASRGSKSQLFPWGNDPIDLDVVGVERVPYSVKVANRSWKRGHVLRIRSVKAYQKYCSPFGLQDLCHFAKEFNLVPQKQLLVRSLLGDSVHSMSANNGNVYQEHYARGGYLLRSLCYLGQQTTVTPNKQIFHPAAELKIRGLNRMSASEHRSFNGPSLCSCEIPGEYSVFFRASQKAASVEHMFSDDIPGEHSPVGHTGEPLLVGGQCFSERGTFRLVFAESFLQPHPLFCTGLRECVRCMRKQRHSPICLDCLHGNGHTDPRWFSLLGKYWHSASQIVGMEPDVEHKIPGWRKHRFHGIFYEGVIISSSATKNEPDSPSDWMRIEEISFVGKDYSLGWIKAETSPGMFWFEHGYVREILPHLHFGMSREEIVSRYGEPTVGIFTGGTCWTYKWNSLRVHMSTWPSTIKTIAMHFSEENLKLERISFR